MNIQRLAVIRCISLDLILLSMRMFYGTITISICHTEKAQLNNRPFSCAFSVWCIAWVIILVITMIYYYEYNDTMYHD